MANDDKTFDLPLGRQSQSEFTREQAWSRLLAQYLHDLPRQLKDMRTTLEVKDFASIKKQAHRIRGTAGTYRFDSISRRAAQLERFADSRNSDAIVAAIDKVMRLVEMETKNLNSRPTASTASPEGNANGSPRPSRYDGR
ncbi:MAG: Hpt domain-containing protein [Planctomycetota bacterium]|jgi:HPt (histidine-containing phosphotransfer) domain-containing protein